MILAEEENQGNSFSDTSTDNFDYNQLGDLDSGLQMDWDPEDDIEDKEELME